MADYDQLSKRERQIMDALHRVGGGSVADIIDTMTDPPSYNSVRVTLSILERKGFVNHEQDGRRYVYQPTQTSRSARVKALRHVVKTFFQDDAPSVVSTLLGMRSGQLGEDELDALGELIAEEREKRRRKGRK